MGLFEDFDRIWDSIPDKPDNEKHFDIIKKKDMQEARRKEDYLSQIYIGWQCPICFEVYNPHILNCVKEHKYGSDKRINYPL